jgi:hypothetical protein
VLPKWLKNSLANIAREEQGIRPVRTERGKKA